MLSGSQPRFLPHCRWPVKLPPAAHAQLLLSPSLLTVTASDLSFCSGAARRAQLGRTGHTRIEARARKHSRAHGGGGGTARHGTRRGDGVRFRQDLRGHLRGDKEERRYVFFFFFLFLFLKLARRSQTQRDTHAHTHAHIQAPPPLHPAAPDERS